MNNTTTTPAPGTGLSTLERAKFGPGMLLQHEDLELLNTYTRNLSRLMFRSLFGCGVVCGLVVKPNMTCGPAIDVGAGLAIACSGDPVYVPRPETLPLDDNCEADLSGAFWVVLCGTVKCCAPRPAPCPSDDEETRSECTRERDGYSIKVIRGDRPPCVCGCSEEDGAWEAEWNPQCKCVNPALECYKAHYAGECGCDCDGCSDCKCDCILLARLEKKDDVWEVDHRVRRFVRPVLMRDPQIEKDAQLTTEESRAFMMKLEEHMEVAKPEIIDRNLVFVREAMQKVDKNLSDEEAAQILRQMGAKDHLSRDMTEVFARVTERMPLLSTEAGVGEPVAADSSTEETTGSTGSAIASDKKKATINAKKTGRKQ